MATVINLSEEQVFRLLYVYGGVVFALNVHLR